MLHTVSLEWLRQGATGDSGGSAVQVGVGCGTNRVSQHTVMLFNLPTLISVARPHLAGSDLVSAL